MSINVGVRETLSQRVAEEIRALLARRRISGRELARRLHVSPSWLNYRLTGTQPIDLNDLERIASALGVPVHELLPRPALVNQATGQFPNGAGEGSQPSIRKVTVAGRSGQTAYPDRVRPRDNRPTGHPGFPVLPPAIRRPVPRKRAA